MCIRDREQSSSEELYECRDDLKGLLDLDLRLPPCFDLKGLLDPDLRLLPCFDLKGLLDLDLRLPPCFDLKGLLDPELGELSCFLLLYELSLEWYLELEYFSMESCRCDLEALFLEFDRDLDLLLLDCLWCPSLSEVCPPSSLSRPL